MCGGYASCEPSTLSSMPVLEEGDESFEDFVCQICLDILYKPIVQACGHVFCFWCVRRSMDQNKSSQCPVCRRRYIYFPRVCLLLHFLLAKAWPEDYKRKENEIQVVEESTKIFSPRILPPSTTTPTMLSALACVKGTPRTKQSYCRIFPEMETPIAKLANTNRTHQSEAQTMINVKDCSIASELTSSDEITIKADLSCICCRKLLYRPVVLNCGEVLCESCCKESMWSGLNPSCPSCRSVHPSGSLGVCLALHHYLERAFPSHYLQRKEEVVAKAARQWHTPLPVAAAPPAGNSESDHVDDIDDKRGYVHIGVGCDDCGMFPIVGHRYHCGDCGEQVGYDLCGSCYTNISITPSNTASNSHSHVGRFNQDHSPEHHMEEMASDRRAPSPFSVVVQYLNVVPLNLSLDNGRIISRRHQQQILDDFDDYIDTFL